jgi:hypothetical protein
MLNMKKCSKCGDEKELSKFYKQANGKPSGYCKICTKFHKKEHYQSNKSSYKEASLKWRKWLIDLKSTLKCEKCGYNKSPAALDFHHINPHTKSFSINNRGCSGKSKEEIKIEINKCVVWCSNCHREYHANCY